MSFAQSHLGRLRAAVGSVPLLTVGIRLLIEDGDGRFLTLGRTDMPLRGLPGGSMELGESLIDAAHREAREETNARLRDLHPFGLSSDPAVETFTYPNGDIVQSVSLLLHAVYDGGPLRANDGEASDLRFEHPDAIDRAGFIAPEYPAFGHWRRFRETGTFQLV